MKRKQEVISVRKIPGLSSKKTVILLNTTALLLIFVQLYMHTVGCV